MLGPSVPHAAYATPRLGWIWFDYGITPVHLHLDVSAPFAFSIMLSFVSSRINFARPDELESWFTSYKRCLISGLGSRLMPVCERTGAASQVSECRQLLERGHARSENALPSTDC